MVRVVVVRPSTVDFPQHANRRQHAPAFSNLALMTIPASQPPPLFPDRTLRDLDLGCRIGFLVLTLMLSYIAVRLSWSFSPAGFSQKLVSGMLKGAPTPLSFKVAHVIQPQLLPLSLALPIAAIVAAFTVRRPLTALLIITGCNLTLALISILLGTAIVDTLGEIISSLS